MKRIGCIGYATHSGLGIILKDFVHRKLITDVLILEHERFENNYDWYPSSQSITRGVSPEKNQEFQILINFIVSIDIIIILESPWSPYVIPLARKFNKKIILMPNHEWTPWPLDVDMIICPSVLEEFLYKSLISNIPIVHINIPVNSEVIWNQRKRSLRFLHNSGRGSSNDRNGTKLLIDSLKFLSNEIDISMRGQELVIYDNEELKNVSVINKSVEFKDLFVGYDTFIFIDRFCGLSLPLQEAYASGMAIITGNRFPINTWLPKEGLVDPIGYEKLNFTGQSFDSAIYDPKVVAAKIDEFHNRDITSLSSQGKEWGFNNSWDKLGVKYESLFQS